MIALQIQSVIRKGGLIREGGGGLITFFLGKKGAYMEMEGLMTFSLEKGGYQRGGAYLRGVGLNRGFMVVPRHF